MNEDAAPPTGNLDDEARCELLTYLVVSQLVAYSRASGWLDGVGVTEATHWWLISNGGRCDEAEREMLCAMSERVAHSLLGLPLLLRPDQLSRYFTDGSRLDYRHPGVRAIFDVCNDYLVRFSGRWSHR